MPLGQGYKNNVQYEKAEYKSIATTGCISDNPKVAKFLGK